MLPTLPQSKQAPATILSEAETLALQWSEFIPLELTAGRAKQIVEFVDNDNPDDPAAVVLKYCIGNLDPAMRDKYPITSENYRKKLCEMKDNIYRKQGFKFVSRAYARLGGQFFNIPDLDMPLLTFESVQRYVKNTPSIFSTGYSVTPDEATEIGKLYVVHGVRIDGLNFMVWML